MIERMRLPNFFLIGAPKAGTTSLYHYLDQHPDIYLSRLKEPTYFAPEAVQPSAAEESELRAWIAGPMLEKREHGTVRDWADYVQLFRHARSEKAIGEGSVAYLGSTTAPARIKEFNPAARVLVILRNPVDLLFSYYKWAHGFDRTNGSFRQWIEDERKADAKRDAPGGRMWTGRYATHLRRWFEHFPREQVHVILFDDYLQSPAAELQSVFDFLRVDSDFLVDTTRRYNETRVPRSRFLYRQLRRVGQVLPKRLRSGGRERMKSPSHLRPTSDERAFVREIYAEEMRVLEVLLARDLSTLR